MSPSIKGNRFPRQGHSAILLSAYPKMPVPLSDPPMEVGFRGQINLTLLAPA
jgi:hypothetical protein